MQLFVGAVIKFCSIRSSSKENGYGKESVIPKYNLALSQVFRNYSVLFTLYNTFELSRNWICTNGFKVKAEMNDSLCSHCCQLA